jgi:hypothetical protein
MRKLGWLLFLSSYGPACIQIKQSGLLPASHPNLLLYIMLLAGCTTCTAAVTTQVDDALHSLRDFSSNTYMLHIPGRTVTGLHWTWEGLFVMWNPVHHQMMVPLHPAGSFDMDISDSSGSGMDLGSSHA